MDSNRPTNEEFKNCDRQSKCDFTASTYNYYVQNGYPVPEYLEMDKNGNLIPFGSPEANGSSREDVFLRWGNIVKAYEIKECYDYPSNIYFKVLDGCICDDKKFPAFDELYAASGITTSWVELYTDDKIRIWPLYKMDKENLPRAPFRFRKWGIKKNSPKIVEIRPKLDVKDAIMIDRIRDKSINDDQQGDS